MMNSDFRSFFDQDQFRQKIAALKGTKYFIITDTNTLEHCLPQLDLLAISNLQDAELIEIEPGEESKTIEVCSGVWKTLLEAEADRKSVIVNLGGGMITDLGGYVAAAFKRGIRFVNIPTTLLAMVDAAVGGKVGVNLNHHKNQVGHFSSAEWVWVYPEFLITLPERELISGKAEMYKHGLIADAHHWAELMSGELMPNELQIYNSIKTKLDIVESDREERGNRKKLNFGHTIGHALEAWAYQNGFDVRHGEAVAAGMMVESLLSKDIAGLGKNELLEIHQVMLLNYDFSAWKSLSFEDLLPFLLKDKKNENEQVNFTLLHAIGTSSIDHYIAPDLIKKAWIKTRELWR